MGHACGKTRMNQNVFVDTILDVSRIEKGELFRSSTVLTPEEINSIIDLSQMHLRSNDSNYIAHLNLGICLFTLGYVDAAEPHLLKSRQLCKSYEASYILGLIYLGKNDLKQAQMSFQYSISEAPVAFVYCKLGEVLLRRNKFEEARKYAKQALIQFPRQPDLLSIVGMSYMNSDPRKAAKYCKKAIKENPGLFKAYVNVADIQKAEENYQKAEENYKKAIEQGNSAQKGFAQMMLSLLYFETGNLPKAISFCKKSIKSNPNLEEMMLNKGFDLILKNPPLQHALELIQHKQYQKSIKILKTLYKQDKKNIPICFFLADCFFRLDNESKSKHFFKKVVKMAQFLSNNEVNKLFVCRSERILETQFSSQAENEKEIEEELGQEVQLEESAHEEVGEEEELLTQEGNYPNFQETLKESEVEDEKVSEIKIEVAPPRMIPRNIKSNSLRQFAKSADPEPDKNCRIF